jgi:N-acetylneuraminic acid mutarotase
VAIIILLLTLPEALCLENTWVEKASIPKGGVIYGAAAVNGQIYAFGGYRYNQTTYYTSEKYDPASNVWSPIKSMPTPRINVAVVDFGNKIYVIGGRASDYYNIYS